VEERFLGNPGLLAASGWLLIAKLRDSRHTFGQVNAMHKDPEGTATERAEAYQMVSLKSAVCLSFLKPRAM
jgi:hypothetical protein